jgi:hypothetical protein
LDDARSAPYGNAREFGAIIAIIDEQRGLSESNVMTMSHIGPKKPANVKVRKDG